MAFSRSPSKIPSGLVNPIQPTTDPELPERSGRGSRSLACKQIPSCPESRVSIQMTISSTIELCQCSRPWQLPAEIELLWADYLAGLTRFVLLCDLVHESIVLHI